MADDANKDKNPDEIITPPAKGGFFESKTFRLLTLGIYLAGVSGIGMTLAFYHLFLWDSKMPPIPEIKPHHHVG